MALAVAEAHRVLKLGGLLIDVHPTDEPATLEIWHVRTENNAAAKKSVHCVAVGTLDYAPTSLDDFTASTEVLAQTLDERTHFQFDQVAIFEYQYFFDTLEELTQYLIYEEELASASPALLENARLAIEQALTTPKIVIIQRTNVTALRKI